MFKYLVRVIITLLGLKIGIWKDLVKLPNCSEVQPVEAPAGDQRKEVGRPLFSLSQPDHG